MRPSITCEQFQALPSAETREGAWNLVLTLCSLKSLMHGFQPQDFPKDLSWREFLMSPRARGWAAASQHVGWISLQEARLFCGAAFSSCLPWHLLAAFMLWVPECQVFKTRMAVFWVLDFGYKAVHLPMPPPCLFGPPSLPPPLHCDGLKC